MDTLVKWVGGKRRFIKEIKNYINNHFSLEDIKTYYEPFAGSAALFFDLEKENSVINDYNSNLINFYNNVKNNPNELLKEINNLFLEDIEKTYYEKRIEFNETVNDDSLRNAALFFYLNKTGFNGVYRVNQQGQFNVPIGSSKTYKIPTLEELEHAQKLLKRTKIFSDDWANSILSAGQNDLIYLDPPYYPDSSSKFIGYTDPRFGIDEHVRMMEILKEKLEIGVKIVISNSNSDEFEKLVIKKIGKNRYTKYIIETNRSINPNAENKERFKETLYILENKND